MSQTTSTTVGPLTVVLVHGAFADASSGTLTDQRLYQLILQPKPIADRQFEIKFLDAGVEAFAFTFG